MAFIYPSLKQARRHNGKAFVYHLEHRGEGTLLDLVAKLNTTRPNHVDELFLLFNQKTKYGLKGTQLDTQISKQVVKLWTNFAKYQNPTPPGHDFEWPEYEKNEEKYLRITSQGFTVGAKSWEEVYQFWDEIWDPINIKDEL